MDKALLYKDKEPDELARLIDRLKSLRTMGDIRNFIDELYPTWFVTAIDSYSADYPTLNSNWEHVCARLQVPKAQIIIVDYLPNKEECRDHTFISLLAENITRAGFIVRRRTELIPCSNCGKALPTYGVYSLMLSKKLKVPRTWKPNCTECEVILQKLV